MALNIRFTPLTVFVAVLTTLSLVSLLYYVYVERHEAECQRHVNAVFLQTLKDRGDLFEADRNSLYALFDKSIKYRDNPKKQKVALKQWQKRRAQLDQRLEQYQYPDLEGRCQSYPGGQL